MKNLKYLSKENIVSGKLKELVPELYELQEAVEHSADGWHDQEPVLEHTLSVLSALEKTFSESRKLTKMFEEKIDENSRRILLKVATIFHDIGKKDTMIKEGEFTRCPGHEEVGVKKTREILKRFDLSEKEAKRVLDIVANHTELHKLTVPDNPNFQRDLARIRREFGEYIYPELVILTYADTVNSQLRKVNIKEFQYRIDFYKKEITKLI